MIAEPLVVPYLGQAEGNPANFHIRDFTGNRTIRSARNTYEASNGLRDIITISHSDDPKAKRRRSLLRADLDYLPTGESSPKTVSLYMVLDRDPSTADSAATTPIQGVFERVLGILLGGAGETVQGLTVKLADPTKVINQFVAGEP